MSEVDEAAIAGVGEEGFARMVSGFYRRVRTDDVLGPMYPHDDWEGAERRLLLFLLHRFRRDPRYATERGHPRLRMRHMPFAIGPQARDRWLALMDAAMAEAEIAPEAGAALRVFFSTVAEHMRNRE